ncbi:MAG: hypothetical protein HC800_06895 [Phormidesmis sp. RL_2_1]|nr:hypothetical protein [Phormidesmis sp. RL_2_1]
MVHFELPPEPPIVEVAPWIVSQTVSQPPFQPILSTQASSVDSASSPVLSPSELLGNLWVGSPLAQGLAAGVPIQEVTIQEVPSASRHHALLSQVPEDRLPSINPSPEDTTESQEDLPAEDLPAKRRRDKQRQKQKCQ